MYNLPTAKLEFVVVGECTRQCDDIYIAYYCKRDECHVKWRGCNYERLCWYCGQETKSFRKLLVDNEEMI